MYLVLIVLAIDLVSIFALLCIANRVRYIGLLKTCTFFISLAAACSLGLATQTLLICSLGFATEFQYWFFLAWTSLGLTGFAIAINSRSPPGLITYPCYLVAVASLVYSFLGYQVLGLAMASVMFLVGTSISYALRWHSENTQNLVI